MVPGELHDFGRGDLAGTSLTGKMKRSLAGTVKYISPCHKSQPCLKPLCHHILHRQFRLQCALRNERDADLIQLYLMLSVRLYVV